MEVESIRGKRRIYTRHAVPSALFGAVLYGFTDEWLVTIGPSRLGLASVNGLLWELKR